ncbi:MAG: hypothetical protein PHQ58_17680 [Rhodoferax sp.]|uniref:hypothetical protein n=1 Tax=Rhodoferax sp. TaxID=50421 RepID=UPI002620651D|nr:hypothetical protein [Rhodoferax sp.]MDD2882259.1 hypothetical protein [Rhodoferax sp.]
MSLPGDALHVRPPVATHVREPALSLRTPTLERYRVAGGGLTVVALACELMALHARPWRPSVPVSKAAKTSRARQVAAMPWTSEK